MIEAVYVEYMLSTCLRMLIGHVCSTFLTAHPVQDVFQFMHTSNDITVKDAANY